MHEYGFSVLKGVVSGGKRSKQWLTNGPNVLIIDENTQVASLAARVCEFFHKLPCGDMKTTTIATGSAAGRFIAHWVLLRWRGSGLDGAAVFQARKPIFHYFSPDGRNRNVQGEYG